MADTDGSERLPLLQWFKPTLGAICFGALMYGSMALGARDKPVFGLAFVLIGIAAVIAGKRLMRPYSPSTIAFYIFAGCCIIFGSALLGAKL